MQLKTVQKSSSIRLRILHKFLHTVLILDQGNTAKPSYLHCSINVKLLQEVIKKIHNFKRFRYKIFLQFDKIFWK